MAYSMLFHRGSGRLNQDSTPNYTPIPNHTPGEGNNIITAYRGSGRIKASLVKAPLDLKAYRGSGRIKMGGDPVRPVPVYPVAYRGSGRVKPAWDLEAYRGSGRIRAVNGNGPSAYRGSGRIAA